MPAGRPPRSQAIAADAATVASTNTAVVYAWRCGDPRPHRAPPEVPVHDDRAEPRPSRRQQCGCREEPDRRHVDVHLARQGIAARPARHRGPARCAPPPRRRAAPPCAGSHACRSPPGAAGARTTTSSSAQHSTASNAVTRGGGKAPELPLPEERPRGVLPDVRVLIDRGSNQARARCGLRRPIRRGLVHLPMRRSGYPSALCGQLDYRIRPHAHGNCCWSASLPQPASSGLSTCQSGLAEVVARYAPDARPAPHSRFSAGERPCAERRRPCVKRNGRDPTTAR